MLVGSGDMRSAIAALQDGADGYVDRDEIGVGGNVNQLLTTLRQAMSHRATSLAMAKMEQLKNDFFAMVTHDLRNPAGSIKTAILMLLEDETGPLNVEQRALIEIAEISADKLINLINNYLDYARIDAGFLELVTAQTDLRQVIEASARPAALEAQHRRQTLTLHLPEDPVHAWVDAHRLGHVMDNLLNNAIKYTPHGGSINVYLSIDNEHAMIRVSDTGYGIPPSEIPDVFGRFRRTRNPAVQGIRGTGLGLLIVKEIVERHGGTVEAESEGVPGKGSVFTVCLPLRATTKPPS
jgi:signal transduction histidine kinase